MDYKNVLFGYDGSPEAQKAFEKAIEITKQNHARLVISEIVKQQYANTESVSLGFGIASTDIDIKKALMEREQELEVLKQKAIEAGVSDVQIDLRVGNPKQELSEDIPDKYDIDLTVLGATGLGRVA
ncbi:universal stress protein [Pediococcus claussenii]|uniref:Universal stress family protein n=1 Tax=Pediococcus claussenii (strain ATCC BAA-344 / DSM 14800 / JCM 18046 / KCTC 3811 / LMG 21948 / P06) TaxID=701521 RepID=G8PDV8_PEDCP|nr:universal stress protein [Pediococcus claussenii]AEV95443.1 universal stress family protein [Pediococcus claussenii ATCC BAA-344]KRN19085.1 hypothetical protein IV79_GL001747 [Pediococcus claussenii]